MPSSVAARLKQISPKLERARQHVIDAEVLVMKFLRDDPFKVGAKRDPGSRRLIYYLASVEPTPEGLALILGDAVQNLMSALDHLSYQIVCSDTSDNPPNTNR